MAPAPRLRGDGDRDDLRFVEHDPRQDEARGLRRAPEEQPVGHDPALSHQPLEFEGAPAPCEGRGMDGGKPRRGLGAEGGEAWGRRMHEPVENPHCLAIRAPSCGLASGSRR